MAVLEKNQVTASSREAEGGAWGWLKALLAWILVLGFWGMSEEVGPVDVRDSDEHRFLGREIAQPRHFSAATAAADTAVLRYLLEAEERARAVLKAHKPKVERLISELESNETLDRDVIAVCLGPKSVSAPGRPAPHRSRANDAKDS